MDDIVVASTVDKWKAVDDGEGEDDDENMDDDDCRFVVMAGWLPDRLTASQWTVAEEKVRRVAGERGKSQLCHSVSSASSRQLALCVRIMLHL